MHVPRQSAMVPTKIRVLVVKSSISKRPVCPDILTGTGADRCSICQIDLPCFPLQKRKTPLPGRPGSLLSLRTSLLATTIQRCQPPQSILVVIKCASCSCLPCGLWQPAAARLSLCSSCRGHVDFGEDLGGPGFGGACCRTSRASVMLTPGAFSTAKNTV